MGYIVGSCHYSECECKDWVYCVLCSDHMSRERRNGVTGPVGPVITGPFEPPLHSMPQLYWIIFLPLCDVNW